MSSSTACDNTLLDAILYIDTNRVGKNLSPVTVSLVVDNERFDNIMGKFHDDPARPAIEITTERGYVREKSQEFENAGLFIKWLYSHLQWGWVMIRGDRFICNLHSTDSSVTISSMSW